VRAVLFGSNVAAILALGVLRRRRIETAVVAPFRGPTHAWHASLYDHARGLGITALYDPHSVNGPLFVSEMSRFRPDIILSVYYNQLFDTRLLSLPRIGCFTLHPSLLPKDRGVAPLIWAILNHERRTGMTLHLIDEGVDTGPIVLQKAFPISPKDTGYALHMKAAREAGAMVDAFCRMLAAGRIPRRPQRGRPSYFPRDLPSRNAVRWTWSRRDVVDTVRALARPLPGAYAAFEGERVMLLEARIPSGRPRPPAGVFPGMTWWDARRRALLVQCADGPVALVQLHAGGRDLTAAGFRAHALADRATVRFGVDARPGDQPAGRTQRKKEHA
jgi:methionyl-tRNA formyltransferase